MAAFEGLSSLVVTLPPSSEETLSRRENYTGS